MSIDASFHIRRGEFELNAAFSIPDQGVTAIFGPSGSGKTLTLRAMAGLDRVPGGEMRVGDVVWQDTTHFIPPHQRGLGYVFQEASLFNHLSVMENLAYATKRAPINPARLTLHDAAALLSITSLLDRRPNGLSGGERQRVAIARALLTDPCILFMDEPLSSLDQAGKNEILPFLERLRTELDIPLIYVTHSTDEVAQLADFMVFIEHGSVQATGPIQEMLTRLDLPLALGRDAEAILEATVESHDEEHGLTVMSFTGGQIVIPSHDLPSGRKVRVRLRAPDVSLTLEHHRDTSILNILKATVVALSENEGPQVTILLDAGGVPILSRITKRSAARLNLKKGSAVFAQIKSVALLT